ncbi:MAG: sulfatase [Sphingobacteriales bacterium 41-5]|nr:MAG: sulfatase [Sphingobacteriales bacterium 41-5]
MKRLFSILIFLTFIATTRAQNRPNIILILADDMGYSDIGSYGGEVQTPNLDKLAKEGIRYRQFYNMARCCPTRASLMTGLYPHQAGMGWMAAADLGTPSYQGNLNKECVTIAEVLKTTGYSTYMTGKWHLTNERKIEGEVIDNWPRQRGFDRFFGIIPGAANYFTPFVYSDNKRYKASDDGNYYLTDAISDTSVKFINDHFTKNNSNPLFMYVAYNAPHWPLHAPKKAIEKYKQQYLKGWDVMREQRFAKQKQIGLLPANAVMSPRDETVEAWDNLNPAQKEEMASRMAIYAAQIDIMDEGIGRIVNALRKNKQLDNTLIFFLSDNGACAEFITSGKSKAVDGTADTWESYRINWANVSSTPFRKYKHYTHEGGVATPLIVHWPDGIKKNLDNSYAVGYGHLPDIMATCIDVAKAKYPSTFKNNKIHALEGTTLVPNFSGQSNHKGKMFWEHEANIAVRDGKWKLVASTKEDAKFDKANLELYDMDTDPTEMSNLKNKYPQRVENMYNDWLKFANRIDAFPLDTREYNARMQYYRRNINGEFDDNFGGWNIRPGNSKVGIIEIDKGGRISGKNSALVEIKNKNGKPADLAMFWPFRINSGEKFSIALKTKANKPVNFYVRLEKTDEPSIKLIDELIKASNETGNHNFVSKPAGEGGMYRVALYYGAMNAGDKVWVDDVRLAPSN